MKNVVGRVLAFIMVVAIVGGVVAMFVNNLAHYNMKKELEKSNQEISEDTSEKSDQSEKITIDFSVIFPDDDEKEKTLSGNFENLRELLETGMSNLGLEFEEENGSVITSVNSIENEDDGKWNIYINGALLQAPLNSISVNNNDIVKIIWDQQ